MKPDPIAAPELDTAEAPGPLACPSPARGAPAVEHGRTLGPAIGALRGTLRRYVARRAPAAEVEDLVQDVLLRMHERAGELRDETRLAGWALRIAASVVADRHRRRRPEEPHAEPPAEAAPEGEAPENLNELVAGWLPPMLALLPAEYEEALQLVDVEGLGQKEYAERVGLSLSGAKSRVQRGRRMLEEILLACCEVETDPRGNVIGYERRGACSCAPPPSAPPRR